MSWISDVRQEISELDTSVKSLRKFAFVIGLAFLLIAAGMWLSGTSHLRMFVLVGMGGLLILSGAICPGVLAGIYRIWMGVALALGWVVSRILLCLIFYLVIAPIGLLARLSGKEFLMKNTGQRRESYWIRKDQSKKRNYEKMY